MMKVLIDPKHKRRNKPLIFSLLIVFFAVAGAALYLYLQDHEKPAPNFVMNSSAETHIPIQEWTTPHGMKVLYVPVDELPMIDLRLMFAAGSAYDNNLSGLAELTSQVLLQGTAQYDANTIAARIDNSGAQLDVSVSRDMTALAFRSMSKPELFEEAITTFLSILAEPTFPEDVFVREQQRLIANLQEQQQLPNVVASLTFYPALYDSHPYAQPVTGKVDTVAKITRDNLAAFSSRYYSTQNAVLAIVGDIDLTAAHALINRIETALPTDIPPAEALPEPVLSAKSTINVPFSSTQTHIIYGTLGMSWKDPDFFPLYVGNSILGASGLVSILFNEVREVRGLAYNITSQLTPLLQKGPFIIYAQTRNEASEDAIAVIQELVQAFSTNGPTPEQLQAAQSNITGNFALRLDSNAAVAEQLALMGFYDLPADYLASFRAHVLAVTAEQIRTAFQKRINLNDAILVTVGNPTPAKTVEPKK
jgi:zinc protease